MANESNQSNGYAGFHIEDCGEVTLNGSGSIGYEKGFVVKGVQKLEAQNTYAIREINNQDFEQVKREILNEIETMLNEARQGNDSTKMQTLVQFISSVGSASLVEILKAQGILPRV